MNVKTGYSYNYF